MTSRGGRMKAAVQSSVMPPSELTLIVAATRTMGIGRAGQLPWTGLKKEMAYFARVTSGSSLVREIGTARNAIIMGRKTWNSIPERFRPLKDRVNVVLSRSHSKSVPSGIPSDDGPLELSSLDEALDVLQGTDDVCRIFVIGGAEIYRAALGLRATRRILLTQVASEYDCDTFLPFDVRDERWQQRTNEELAAWVGEPVPAGLQEEKGVKYEFQMFERTDNALH